MASTSQLVQLADFVVNANATNTKDLLDQSNGICIMYCKCIALLWPELSDPAQLEFMLTYYEKDTKNVVPDEMKPDDDDDAAAAATVESFIETSLLSVLGSEVYSQLDFSRIEDFLRARIMVVNQMTVDDPLYCLPLVEALKLEVDPWVLGILKPFSSFQKYSTLHSGSSAISSIKDFNQAANLQILTQMIHYLQTSDSEKQLINEYQLQPYINYTHTQTLFIDTLISSNLPINYATMEFLVSTRFTSFSEDDTLSFFEKLLANLWGNYKFYSRAQLTNLLAKFPPETTIALPIGNKKVEDLTKYVDLCEILKVDDFNQILDLQKNENNVQPVYFNLVCDNYFQQRNNDLNGGTPWFLESALFSKIDQSEKNSIIIESLIKNDKLIDLKKYCKGKVDQDLLLNHFWKLFYKAQHGVSGDSIMIQCYKIANIVEASDLVTLLDLVTFLSTSFPNLQILPNQAFFKPCHILQLKKAPLSLVDKLLRCKELQYQFPEDTMQILKKLFGALEITDIDDLELHATILASHIEIALAKIDFNFAYTLTMQLLENKYASNYWFVILQVGKFIDADNWPDLETPTEIVFLQMEILSKLLMVIPADDMESAVSEYSRLELELSTRNLTNDEYSLENQRKFNNSTNYKKFISSFKSNITNLLKE